MYIVLQMQLLFKCFESLLGIFANPLKKQAVECYIS